MKNIKEKLLLIYFPLVIATILITIIYSLLNWIFVIQLEWFSIYDIVVDIFGPIIFSFIIISFVLIFLISTIVQVLK